MEVTANSISLNILPDTRRTDFNDALDLVEQRISEAADGAQDVVREMCTHIAEAGGKRIRPRLVLNSGMAFSGLNDRVIDTAVAAELIHMASLVHDDVIDQSPLRRGRPSVNKEWGNHAAVLCGDWLFAQAFGILSGIGMNKSLRFMVEAIQSMCHGELLQAKHMYDLNTDIDTYYSEVTGKTGKLLESCCKAGAAAGGADSRGVDALGKYGLNLGMAFQIIDDILDFKGSAGKMGKPKGEDLRQGFITLPVILLLQDGRFGGDARKALPRERYSEDALDAIQELLVTSGSIGSAKVIAWSFLDKTLSCLDILPDSEGKAALYDLAESLRNREN